MNFKPHFDLKDKHAFLSPSKYHWLNYSEDDLATSYSRSMAVQKGVVLHNFASMAINLRQKQPRLRLALNAFVNDAIGYNMVSEQPLYYSDNAFGTTDAISFRDGLLRIHDLKTGVTPASIKQLLIYAALFCLEYSVDPFTIKFELRIYQGVTISVEIPSSEDVKAVMDRIVDFDRKLTTIQLGLED
jgi:hypothetical protein